MSDITSLKRKSMGINDAQAALEKMRTARIRDLNDLKKFVADAERELAALDVCISVLNGVERDES